MEIVTPVFDSRNDDVPSFGQLRTSDLAKKIEALPKDDALLNRDQGE